MVFPSCLGEGLGEGVLAVFTPSPQGALSAREGRVGEAAPPSPAHCGGRCTRAACFCEGFAYN